MVLLPPPIVIHFNDPDKWTGRPSSLQLVTNIIYKPLVGSLYFPRTFIDMCLFFLGICTELCWMLSKSSWSTMTRLSAGPLQAPSLTAASVQHHRKVGAEVLPKFPIAPTPHLGHSPIHASFRSAHTSSST